MKTVVITGSSRGLGLELAKCFRKENYNVVISGTNQKNIEKAYTVLEEMHAKGEILGQVCNVSNLKEVEELADVTISRFGSIDIWINNAGVNQSYVYAWEVEEKEIDFLLNVDLKGTINGSSVAMRHMISQGRGAIYNVEGMGSNDAFQPCFAIYGTAKRAVTYYTDALSKEVDENGYPILVGKLSPGIMITDFLTSAKGEQNVTSLNEKTKKVYNILGDYPDVIAQSLVKQMLSNTKNGKRLEWLTSKKAAWRFLTASFNKRDFFSE